MDDSLNLVSEKIIGCAFTVSDTLGAGFLEKVYQNALVIELSSAGLQVEKENLALSAARAPNTRQLFGE